MKDFNKKTLTKTRPQISIEKTVPFCLNALYKDKEHCITDLVCYELSYEELIGALLQAQDLIKEHLSWHFAPFIQQ